MGYLNKIKQWKQDKLFRRYVHCIVFPMKSFMAHSRFKKNIYYVFHLEKIIKIKLMLQTWVGYGIHYNYN